MRRLGIVAALLVTSACESDAAKQQAAEQHLAVVDSVCAPARRADSLDRRRMVLQARVSAGAKTWAESDSNIAEATRFANESDRRSRLPEAELLVLLHTEASQRAACDSVSAAR